MDSDTKEKVAFLELHEYELWVSDSLVVFIKLEGESCDYFWKTIFNSRLWEHDVTTANHAKRWQSQATKEVTNDSEKIASLLRALPWALIRDSQWI